MNIAFRNAINRRPRLINLLHAAHLYPAYSSTTARELDCLSRHASGKRLAIEIGTQMGVSAVAIARALDESGILYCVDPWLRRNNAENPSLLITQREVGRNRVVRKVKYVRGFSSQVSTKLPSGADFMFVDGDHSWSGIDADWKIVQDKLASGGIVCFHDTTAVTGNPADRLESVDYFREVISRDPSFCHVETCETLNVLRRVH